MEGDRKPALSGTFLTLVGCGKKTYTKGETGVKLPPGISPLLDEIKTKFQKLPPFSGSNFLMELFSSLWDETGSQKFNMAVKNRMYLYLSS